MQMQVLEILHFNKNGSEAVKNAALKHVFAWFPYLAGVQYARDT